MRPRKDGRGGTTSGGMNLSDLSPPRHREHDDDNDGRDELPLYAQELAPMPLSLTPPVGRCMSRPCSEAWEIRKCPS